jgi:hypothetical protein
MIDFTETIKKTKRSLKENKRFIIETNKDFLRGKSLLEFGVFSGSSLSLFSNLYDEFGLEKI